MDLVLKDKIKEIVKGKDIVQSMYNLVIDCNEPDIIKNAALRSSGITIDLASKLNLDSTKKVYFSGFTKGFSRGGQEDIILENTEISPYFFIQSVETKKDYEGENFLIKLYATINPSEIRKFFNELIPYCYNNNTSVYAKSREIQTNDMVTVRIYDFEKLDEVVSIIKKYQVEPKRENEFIPKYNGVGLTFDYHQSYNSYLADLFVDYNYINSNAKLIGEEKELTNETLLEFARQRNDRFYVSKSDYTNLLNLELAVNKKELTKEDIEKEFTNLNSKVKLEIEEKEKEIKVRDKLKYQFVKSLKDLRLDDVKIKIDELLNQNDKVLDNYSLRDIYYNQTDEEIKSIIYNECLKQKKINSKEKEKIVKEKVGNIISNIILNCAIKIEKNEDPDEYIKKFLDGEKIVEGLDLSLPDLFDYYLSKFVQTEKSSYLYILDGATRLIEEKIEFDNYISPLLEKIQESDIDSSKDDWSINDSKEATELNDISYIISKYDVSPEKLPHKDIRDIPLPDESPEEEVEEMREYIKEKGLSTDISKFGLLVLKLSAYDRNIDISKTNESTSSYKIMFEICKKYLEQQNVEKTL